LRPAARCVVALVGIGLGACQAIGADALDCPPGKAVLVGSGRFQLAPGCRGEVRVLVVGGGGAGGPRQGAGGGSGYVANGDFRIAAPVEVTVGAPGQASRFGGLLTAAAGVDAMGDNQSTGGAGGSSGGGKYYGYQGGQGGSDGGRGGERNSDRGNGAPSQGAPFPLGLFTRAAFAPGDGGAGGDRGGGGGGGVVIDGSIVGAAAVPAPGCSSGASPVRCGGAGYGAGGGGGEASGGAGASGVVYVEWDG
jgi:hypothetical protein